MDWLRSPTPSDLAKKRVTKRNPPRNAKRIKPPRQGHNLSPAQRVAQYKNEPFVVSGGKLFCQACRGEEIARELISVLQVQYGVCSNSLVAAMHDRASTNKVTMRFVSVMYPGVVDISCFSHTINNAGSCFKTPHLNEFLTYWLRLFSHSPKARILWKNRTGTAVQSLSETRWWSKWEVANQLMSLFGDVRPFLDDAEEEEVGLATRTKMQAILDDPKKKSLLQLELAITIDAGRPFVQATYQLEEDGALSLICYEEIGKMLQAIRVAHYPNVNRIAQNLSCGQPTITKQHVEYALGCVQPGFTYIQNKLQGELLPALSKQPVCVILTR